MASIHIDGTHLRESILPRLNQYIRSASFAPERFYVQRVFVCAAVISQEEAVIHDLLKTMPSWSTTQDNLDWQPDDERRSAGDVYQHLQAMSRSATDCPKPDQYLFKDVESSNTTDSMICSHSFRLSSLEICNAEEPKGYHIGATALQNLPGFEGYPEECERWRKLLLQYIIEEDNESPYIVWGRRKVATAVVWQVQLDIVDTSACRSLSRPSHELKRRRRYGPMAQVPLELPAPAEKGIQSHDSCVGQKKNKFGDCKSEYKSEHKGVRFRNDRGPTGVWMAETRLPAEESLRKRNKVSFGDYKSDYEAARAIDVAWHYYGKKPLNFPDTPELLKKLPSLDGLEGEEKLRAVKDRAKWLAANAPLPSTSPPSSPIPTACSLQETMASPRFSRSNSGESDGSALDEIILDHTVIDNLLEETMASPGFSRSYSGESDGSALDEIILDHTVIDNLLEPSEMNQAVDGIILDRDMMDNLFQEPFDEERTHSSFGDEMSWIFELCPELLSTQASSTHATFSTALFSQYDNCYNMGNWVDASATQSTSHASQVSQVSQVSIVAGSRL